MNRKWKWSSLLAFLLIGILAAASCSSPTATPTLQPTATPTRIVASSPTAMPTPTLASQITAAPTPTAKPTATSGPPPAPETLKIGHIGLLSGAAAVLGVPVAHGVEVAIERVNTAGGVVTPSGKRYMLQLITYDGAHTMDAGRNAAERLVNLDKVQYITLAGTGAALGAQVITEPAKVILTCISGASEIIEGKTYTFRGMMGAEFYTDFTEWLIKNRYPNTKKVFVTWWDDPTGRSSWAGQKPRMDAMVARLGIQYIHEFHKYGETDFYPFITAKVLPYNPDMIVTIQPNPGSFAAFLKQVREAGFQGPALWPNAMGLQQVLSLAGAAGEHAYFTQDWVWDGDFVPPVQKELAKEYTARFGGSPGMYFFTGLDMVTQIVEGIEKADSVLAVDVVKVLPDIEWDSSFGGKGKFVMTAGRKSSPVYTYCIAGIVNGKLVNVGAHCPVP